VSGNNAANNGMWLIPCGVVLELVVWTTLLHLTACTRQLFPLGQRPLANAVMDEYS
jgi:hypothetical protein